MLRNCSERCRWAFANNARRKNPYETPAANIERRLFQLRELGAPDEWLEKFRGVLLSEASQS